MTQKKRAKLTVSSRTAYKHRQNEIILELGMLNIATRKTTTTWSFLQDISVPHWFHLSPLCPNNQKKISSSLTISCKSRGTTTANKTPREMPRKAANQIPGMVVGLCSLRKWGGALARWREKNTLTPSCHVIKLTVAFMNGNHEQYELTIVSLRYFNGSLHSQLFPAIPAITTDNVASKLCGYLHFFFLSV